MRLSETITIYLAAGASFGVYHFLRDQNPDGRFHSLMRAAHTTMLWPLAAAKMLLSRSYPDEIRPADETGLEESAGFVEKITQEQRDLLAALYGLIELTQVSSGEERAKVERAACVVRETVEKYVGLTIAAAEIDMDARPSAREMEFSRVAGRRGDDLVLAGRCVHRRNAARLITHQARARIELLHALAEIREITGNASSSMNVVLARHVSVAVVRFYSHVFNLLSLLEDETANASVARLLDAECGRLRRLEALNLKESSPKEVEPCQTHARHPVFNVRSQIISPNQG